MFSRKFSNPCGPFSLSYLAQIADAYVYNDNGSSFVVSNVTSLTEAQSDSISMLNNKKYIGSLKQSLAGACIVEPANIVHAPKSMYLLVHKNPYKAYALIAQAFYPEQQSTNFIDSSAYCAPSATIGADCFIAHGAYIGDNVTIGDRCSIGVNTYIGSNVVIGHECRLESHVSISNTIMGNNVLIYPGARIGQDGFGFASDVEGHYKIPHQGGVIIGDNVSIGANTCIDRGSLKNTEIGDWCRIDNLVQIGHNVVVGRGSILCGQTGIAGSSTLGEFVTAGGQVGISGHITIGSYSTILVGSTVVKTIAPGSRVGGYPAIPYRDWHKQTALLKRAISNINTKQIKDS